MTLKTLYNERPPVSSQHTPTRNTYWRAKLHQDSVILMILVSISQCPSKSHREKQIFNRLIYVAGRKIYFSFFFFFFFGPHPWHVEVPGPGIEATATTRAAAVTTLDP